jgi:hypothetical protein
MSPQKLRHASYKTIASRSTVAPTCGPMTQLATNGLYYGDNLGIPRCTCPMPAST